MDTQVSALAPQIFETIKSSRRILLHAHPSPDPDSYGSALAMLHYLEGQGKEVVLIKGDSPVPDFVQFLPGGEKVVEKSYLEIDPASFDLFIALDVSKLDRVSALGSVNFPSGMKTIMIDHHITNEAFADINLVAPEYPATAQILFELLAVWQVKITHEMAVCLFIGIYFDTGGFKYRSATAETLRAAASLAEIAPEYSKVIFEIENNNQAGSIRFQGLALSSVKNYFDNRVAISELAYEQIQERGIDENDSKSASVASILKSVKSWEIGVSLFEWQSGVVKISARTRDPVRFDLSKFIVLLGGGGHPSAAGASLRGEFSEVRQRVLGALGEAYPILKDINN